MSTCSEQLQMAHPSTETRRTYRLQKAYQISSSSNRQIAAQQSLIGGPVATYLAVFQDILQGGVPFTYKNFVSEQERGNSDNKLHDVRDGCE